MTLVFQVEAMEVRLQQRCIKHGAAALWRCGGGG